MRSFMISTVLGMTAIGLMAPAQATPLNDAAISLEKSGGRGILLVMQEPPKGGLENVIEALNAAASQIYVGVGNGSGVFSIDRQRHDAIIDQFKAAGFNVCPQWGYAYAAYDPGYDFFNVMKHEVKDAITSGADVALLVDKGDLSLTGLEYQPSPGGEPFVGGVQGNDEAYIGIGSSSGGSRITDDAQFSRLHFLSAMFIDDREPAPTGCMIGH